MKRLLTIASILWSFLLVFGDSIADGWMEYQCSSEYANYLEGTIFYGPPVLIKVPIPDYWINKFGLDCMFYSDDFGFILYKDERKGPYERIINLLDDQIITESLRYDEISEVISEYISEIEDYLEIINQDGDNSQPDDDHINIIARGDNETGIGQYINSTPQVVQAIIKMNEYLATVKEGVKISIKGYSLYIYTNLIDKKPYLNKLKAGFRVGPVNREFCELVYLMHKINSKLEGGGCRLYLKPDCPDIFISK